MSNSHFQVIPDGYVSSEVYTLGNSTIGPILTQYGEQRVVIDVVGASVSVSNPLPVTLEGGSGIIGKVDIQDTNGAAIVVGQALMASSIPVVIASNQSSLPVTLGASSAVIGHVINDASSAVIGHVITDSGSVATVSQATASSLNAQVVGTAAAGATASGNPVQIGGVYNSSAPTASTGQMEPLQLDINGNLKDVEQYAPVYENNSDGVAYGLQRAIATNSGAWSVSSSVSGGVGTAGVSIKGSAGRVRSIRVSNTNATTGYWLQLHNKATAAVNNDVPVDRIFVPSQTIAGAGGSATQLMDFGSEGIYLGTGISIAASSTAGLLTLIGSTDMLYRISWI